jgi:hypothetical protein
MREAAVGMATSFLRTRATIRGSRSGYRGQGPDRGRNLPGPSLQTRVPTGMEARASSERLVRVGTGNKWRPLDFYCEASIRRQYRKDRFNSGMARPMIADAMPRCSRCEDLGWVCENHPERPWNKALPNGCECGAGMPCPACNVTDADNPSRLPASLKQPINIPTSQPKYKRYRPTAEEQHRTLTINAGKGGKTAAKNLTRDERRARARHASRARWAKERDK